MSKDDALIEAVIEQMKIDIESQDWTAIAAMLESVPREILQAFLPENGAMWENLHIEGESK